MVPMWPLKVLPAPQVDYRPPPLAVRFAPAGPPHPTRVEAGPVRVTSVPGRYGVTHLIEGQAGLALVDVGSIADLPRLAGVIEQLGRPVRLVIPSHFHFDHILGLDAAAQRFGAPVALPALAWAHLQGGRRLRWTRLLRASRVFFQTWLWQGLPLFAREDLPMLKRFGFPWADNRFGAPIGPVLRDGEALEGFPGWKILETPGHSDDSFCLHHPQAGFLVCGDTIRNFQGGEWNGIVTDAVAYARSQRRLRVLPIQAVFPGHGPVIMAPEALQQLWDRSAQAPRAIQ
jgi:glyoxylase-like metal-dependent hydrolase (beta-lactamase superfamily II)